MISYNDCDFTRELYDDFYIMHFERQNSMSSKKDSVFEELLITSYDPRPMLAQRAKQFNMFEQEGDFEKGELVLIHEAHRPVIVSMPSVTDN